MASSEGTSKPKRTVTGRKTRADGAKVVKRSDGSRVVTRTTKRGATARTVIGKDGKKTRKITGKQGNTNVRKMNKDGEITNIKRTIKATGKTTNHDKGSMRVRHAQGKLDEKRAENQAAKKKAAEKKPPKTGGGKVTTPRNPDSRDGRYGTPGKKSKNPPKLKKPAPKGRTPIPGKSAGKPPKRDGKVTTGHRIHGGSRTSVAAFKKKRAARKGTR